MAENRKLRLDIFDVSCQRAPTAVWYSINSSRLQPENAWKQNQVELSEGKKSVYVCARVLVVGGEEEATASRKIMSNNPQPRWGAGSHLTVAPHLQVSGRFSRAGVSSRESGCKFLSHPRIRVPVPRCYVREWTPVEREPPADDNVVALKGGWVKKESSSWITIRNLPQVSAVERQWRLVGPHLLFVTLTAAESGVEQSTTKVLFV